MKRFIALAIAVVMVAACFAACGKTDADSNNTGSSKDEKEFLIGGIGPLTGAAAVYGTAVKNGAQLAIDEINAAGGVNGMKLAMNFQDDEHNAEKAINAYNVLKDAGAKLLMGTVTSAPCIAVAELTAQDNMFQITPSGSAVDCVAEPNAFRICFSDPDQGAASAQYIADHNVASKVAVIYDSSDVYSTGIYGTFKTMAAEKNLEIVSEQSFTSSNNTDFSVAIDAIKNSGAELVFLPIYYQQAALILTQAKQAGFSGKFFGCDGLDGVIKQLGDDAAVAEGVMLLTPFAADAKDEKTQKFTAAYQATFNGETPIQFAADAYDAIYAIKAALEKAEITDPSIDVSDLCDKLEAVMTEITVDGVTGEMTWNENGEPTKPAKAMVIKDGAYSAVD